MKIIMLGLLCSILSACATDGQFYKIEMFDGDYEEVAFELSYDVSFQEGGEMYGNYKLGMLAFYDLYPANSSMEYVIENTDFENFDSVSLFWSQKRIAKEFFLKSAKAGFSPAMIKLAGLIESGDDERFSDSFKWLNKAIFLGNPDAKTLLISRGVQSEDVALGEYGQAHSHIAKAKEIDSYFSQHDPVTAARRRREAEEQYDEALAGIGKLFAAAVAVGLAAELTEPDSSDSLRTRAKKAGFKRGFFCELNGSGCSTNNAPRDVGPIQRPNYANTKSTKIEPIKAVSTDFYQTVRPNPVPPASTSPSSSQQVTPTAGRGYVEPSKSGQCSSDFACGTGQKCVKAPLSSTGFCLNMVYSNGVPAFPSKATESVLPNMSTTGQCNFSVDCPARFTCDYEFKVCVK